MSESSRAVDKKLLANNNQDQSVYGAMVRMGQDFVMRYPLIEPHGNFGSIDNFDDEAAMRYTEGRLSKIGELLLDNSKDNIVPYELNYDSSKNEVNYLAGYFPNLLCNGSTGIAAGMATSMAPHCASDIYDALIRIIDNTLEDKETDINELIDIVKAPDFPTGGIIINPSEVKEAYRTGKGRVKIRGKYVIEDNKIVFTELPYMVKKEALKEKLIELCLKEKIIPNVKDVRDESDSNIRLVVELKNNTINPDLVLKNIFKLTDLQSSFSINNNCLVDKRPVFNVDLKFMLEKFLEHSCLVTTNVAKEKLQKAYQRLNIVQGILSCIDKIDEVTEVVKQSEDVVNDLMVHFNLNFEQANGIANMKYSSISKLANKNYLAEKQSLEQIIEYNSKLSEDIIECLKLVKEKYLTIKQNYFKKDTRRTAIDHSTSTSENEKDYILSEDYIVMYTNNGLIKCIKEAEYSSHKNRGGKGQNLALKEDDFTKQILNVNSKDDLLCFTDFGRCYNLPVYKLPVVNRNGVGKYISNYIQLLDGEQIINIVPIAENEKDINLFFVTKLGIVKKLNLERINFKRGTTVITIRENDSLLSCTKITDDNTVVMMATKLGQGVAFNSGDIRLSGRTAQGVKGVRLSENDEIVSCTAVSGSLLLVTSKGYGKQIYPSLIRITNRNAKGVTIYKPDTKSGNVVSCISVKPNNILYIVTQEGKIIKLSTNTIKQTSRAAKGVKLIDLADEDTIKTIAISDEEVQEEV